MAQSVAAVSEKKNGIVASRRRIKLQCLVLGAANAGKTCLCRRYFYDAYDQGVRVPTLGSDFYTSRVPHPDDECTDVAVNLQLWDTPGRERFYMKRQRKYAASLTDAFFRQAHAIMLVYDMTSSTSFTQLLKWYADLLEVYKNNPLPILIVANKLDLFQADQQRATTVVHPRRVSQRDVIGLEGTFRGADFCYEYRISNQNNGSNSALSSSYHQRMEISSFLANRENWTNNGTFDDSDGSYLDSLLNSEDGSPPDREMVLLWCMRNGLKHMEVSAATGLGVQEAMNALIQLGLDYKGDHQIDYVQPDPQNITRRNPSLDLTDRYAPKEERCACLRPWVRWCRMGGR